MTKRSFLFTTLITLFVLNQCAFAEVAHINVCNTTPYNLHVSLAKNVPHSSVTFTD